MLLRLLLISLLSIAPGFAQDSVLLDRIVAVVNENVILQSELADEVVKIRQQLQQQNITLPPEEVLLEQVLERLILIELQLQQAEKRGITVDDTTLNENLRNIARQQNLTLEQLRQKIVEQGAEYQDFREDLRKDIIINRLVRSMVHSRIVISEREIEDYLLSNQAQNDDSEYLLSHLQIEIPEAATADVIQEKAAQADELYKRLKQGTDFAELALIESDGRNALQGGDLGWRKPSELPSAFAQVVQTLQVGEFTEPFRTPRGFHILLLRDSKGVEKYIVEQIRARHILIDTNSVTNDEQAQTRLANIRKRIQNGTDFAEMAQSYSDDPGSRDRGGELGWNEPEIFVPEFAKVLRSLPVGVISEPFKSSYGWHIAEVLERREYDKTQEHQIQQAQEVLFQRKANVEEELWLRRLRDEAYVEYRLTE